MFRDATLQTVGDMTSSPETGRYITDRREPVDTSYVERVLICLSGLMAIIEMGICKSLLPRRVTAVGSTDKTSTEPLDSNKSTESYCDLLLAGITVVRTG